MTARVLTINSPKPGTCALCQRPSEGHYSIHRDSPGEGPEVDLCDACGSKPTPTCPEIWSAISQSVS